MGNKNLTKLKQELQEKEKQIEKMRKEFGKLLKVKEDLISTVSHELRTPLSIIKEGLNLTLDEVTGKINPKQKQFLTVSKQNVDRLSNLINDLLDISKIEAKKVILKKGLIDLNSFIKHIVFHFENIAKEKKISMTYKLPQKKVSSFFDADRVTQVLTNLISNALKFTKQGGRITITVHENPSDIQLSVCDTGAGISKNNLDRLFNKFVQIDRPHGPGEKGTGLGLAISKGLIELHGGKIWAESALGRGSKFHFTIPKAGFEDIFREYVKNGIKDSRDMDKSFSILVSRIDNFDVLKKKYGMVKPYLILEDLLSVMKSALRRVTDTTIRNSGECAIFLSGTNKHGAVSVEQRIREGIAKYLISKKLDREVQVSLGNSSYPEDAQDNIEMIARARAFFEGLYIGKERRDSERRYARLNIEFLNASSKPSKSDKEQTQSINISRGGLCIFSNRKLPLGCRLNLDIKLPQKMTPVNALAKIVWVKKINKLTGFNYKMGLRYENIDQGDVDEILELASKQG